MSNDNRNNNESVAHSRAPNANELMAMISQLQEQIGSLEAKQSVRSVKIRPPEPFDGTRSKLRAFLTQLDMYIRIHHDKLSLEADKVLFAATYLTGPAFNWFEPCLRDFNGRDNSQQDEETRGIFANYSEFKKRLSDTFGDIDSVRNAERKLRRVRQNGSAGTYASEFQQIISHLDWDDDAYISIFEAGLKPEIQEKLLWQDRPDNLKDMIAAAVKIDNRLYDFNLKRREQRQHWHGNTGRRNDRYQANDRRMAQPRSQGHEDPYGPRPMELDATQRVSKDEQRRRLEKNLCFNCGKPGHMRKDCRIKERATRQINAIGEDQQRYDTTGIRKPMKRKQVELRATHDKGDMKPGGGADTRRQKPEGGLDTRTHGGNPVKETGDNNLIASLKEAETVMTQLKEQNKYLEDKVTQIEMKKDDSDRETTWTELESAYDEELEARKILGWASDDDEVRTPISSDDEPTEGKNTQGEPDQQDSNALFDERYGTQVEGLDPNKEEPTEQTHNIRRESPCVQKKEEKGACPCDNNRCACVGYQRHPQHKMMHYSACYEDYCTTHYDAKMESGKFPRKPRKAYQPQWRKELSATQWGYHLKLVTKVLGQPAKTMIDSGATGNFMDPAYQQRLSILGREKAKPALISGLNGEDLGGRITVESGPVPMVVADHIENINLDVNPRA